MKLVKESLLEFHKGTDPLTDLGIGPLDSKKIKVLKFANFMNDNRETIVEEYIEKFKRIFRAYIPCKWSEDDINECRSIWWNKIVETGWNPKILNDKKFNEHIELDEENLIIDLNDSMTGEALEKLGLPKEIMVS